MPAPPDPRATVITSIAPPSCPSEMGLETRVTRPRNSRFPLSHVLSVLYLATSSPPVTRIVTSPTALHPFHKLATQFIAVSRFRFISPLGLNDRDGYGQVEDSHGSDMLSRGETPQFLGITLL